MTGLAWHGIDRAFVRTRCQTRGRTLAELVERPLHLDPAGVDAAWGRSSAHERSVIAGVERAPLLPLVPRAAPLWSDVFLEAVAAIAQQSARPALALGGGLDAAAVLAAWRALGLPPPTLLTLRTGLPGYDEHERATAIALAFGLRCELVACDTDELLAAAPAAILAIDTPLYNLHPVTRLVLARHARALGHDALITGDGADAVFGGAADLDYVPLVASLTRAAGLPARSPFFDERLIAASLARGEDRQKEVLRALLAQHGAPDWLVRGDKQPRRLPALPLDAVLEARRDRLPRQAARLGRALELGTDAERVGWWTLDLLVERLEH